MTAAATVAVETAGKVEDPADTKAFRRSIEWLQITRYMARFLSCTAKDHGVRSARTVVTRSAFLLNVPIADGRCAVLQKLIREPLALIPGLLTQPNL